MIYEGVGCDDETWWDRKSGTEHRAQMSGFCADRV
jgi:hypothetical protein